MTDLERIRAKFAAEYGLSEDMLRNAERWTETTGDLEGVPENLLPGILGMRFGAIAIDTPRSERWSTPEDIDVIADLAYLPDGGYDTAAGACRGHLLDLYLPHDAVLRGGHTLPVYIDIHGGGFTYGYKELNRNFNVHLAKQGFAVFSLNYRRRRRPTCVGNWPISRRHCVGSQPIWPIIRSIRTRCSSPAIPQVAR